jgi:putative tryptophan/tyrosine transport system substrate-binding protein
MASYIARREFLAALGGAAAAWPLAARAQQTERMRRIGVLMAGAAGDPEGQARLVAFVQGLQEQGWTVGRNVQLDVRWTAGEPNLTRRYAAELVALAPDVILGAVTTSVQALLEVTRSIPIVFAAATDPVGGGLVASLARPGGNVTGFSVQEFGLRAKSLELLKELAPRIARVAVLRDSTTTGGIAQFAAVQTAAPALGVELTPIDVRDAGEIDRTLAAFVREPNGGLIVTTGARGYAHRELIVKLAAQHRLPAVYPFRYWVNDGGLISYGSDQIDPYRRSAAYVDRILKGEKPADLPVQAPTKYELVINLKTAKALGLEVPPMLLARADEVIE